MRTIKVPVCAYILSLYPQSATGHSGASQTQSSRRPQLRALSYGLAVPSFWSRQEIQQVFSDANGIWDQAAIEFTPVTVSTRSESVPADDQGMWIHFGNHLSPSAQGISVGFVYDLPSNEGGWGGGRIALLSGLKARSGLSGFAGGLLAHELGHVLFNSPNHSSSPSNLMFDRRHLRVVSANLLEPSQIAQTRTRAQNL